MATLTTILDNHFDGHSNLTQGSIKGTGPILADLVQEVEVDLDAIETAATTLSARVTVVEGTLSGADMKSSVDLATAAALPAYTAAGSMATKTLTMNAAAILTVDGVATVLGDRILVEDLGTATGADRGIYTVTTQGTVAVAAVLTRAADANSSAEVTDGMMVPVERGTANAGVMYRLSTNDPIVLDTTALSFASFERYALAAAIADVTKAAASAGTADTIARGDHKHNISTAATGAVAPGDVAAEGAATSLARSDHVHGITCAAGGAVAPGDVAAEGAAVTFSRADHVHGITCAAGGAVAPGDVAAEGAAVTFARADHVHGITCAAGGAVAPGDVAAEGAAVTFARSDHVHGITCAVPVDVTKDAAAEGVAVTFARSDHKHDISTAAASTLLGISAEGAATSLARSDHMHKLEILQKFLAHQGIATAAGNAAAAGARNAHRTFDFDDGLAVVDEQIAFEGVFPQHYNGADVTVRLFWCAAAIAGSVKWDVSFEKIALGVLDIDADSYAAAQTVTTAVPGTSGFVATSSLTFTQAQADAIAGGDLFRLLIMRDSNDAGDDAVGDAQLLAVDIIQ